MGLGPRVETNVSWNGNIFMSSLTKLSSAAEEGRCEIWLLGKCLNLVGSLFRRHLIYLVYLGIMRDFSPDYWFIISPNVINKGHSAYTMPMTLTSLLRNKTWLVCNDFVLKDAQHFQDSPLSGFSFVSAGLVHSATHPAISSCVSSFLSITCESRVEINDEASEWSCSFLWDPIVKNLLPHVLVLGLGHLEVSSLVVSFLDDGRFSAHDYAATWQEEFFYNWCTCREAWSFVWLTQCWPFAVCHHHAELGMR